MSKTKLLGLLVVVALGCVRLSHAANSFVVESRNFEVGQTACSLGIWLNNDVSVVGLVLVLEARSLSGGAFFTGGNPLTRPNRQAGRRLDASPLGSADPGGNWPTASTTNARFDNPAANNTCSGPVSNTYSTAVGSTPGTSPDAWLFSCLSSGNPGSPDFHSISLAPGADPATRDSASWIFIFNANGGSGCFEIDTCCRTPSGHTSLLASDTTSVPVEFTKGTVCLSSPVNLPPTINCPPSVSQAKDPGQNGALVNYDVTYFDEDMTLVPVCSPASGSFFPIGTTMVTCTVTDTFGLADTCSFPVTVFDFEGSAIVVESRDFAIGQTACSLGIWLYNEVDITGLVLILEARSLSGGAFYQGGNPLTRPNRQPGMRLDRSPLGSADPGGNWPAASTTTHRYDVPTFQTCSGPVSHTYNVAVATTPGTSPDGWMHSCVSTGNPGSPDFDVIALAAGADPAPRDSASWIFIFDANTSAGCFEIDTCCRVPAGHTSFVDMQTQEIAPQFAKGVVCLGVDPGTNFPPTVTCPPVVWQSVDGSGAGAIVNYTINVSDEDPTLEAVCSPPSGSFFDLGTTLVTCIATDTAGLADTCSFEVVVHNAQENSVTIESKTFQPGQTACSVGVFISNTEPVAGMVLIFELRTIDGAFYMGPVGSSFFRVQPGQRLDDSPLGSANPPSWPVASTIMRRFDTTNTFNTCSGPISRSWGASVASVGGTSPDAVEHATVSQGNESMGEQISLVPGADPMFTSSASLVFVFDADTSEGCFEIDTACTTPSNHLNFVDVHTSGVDPLFTKGIICISNCECNCHANPATCDDPQVNILDVLYTVNVAFRGFAEIDDNNPLCPTKATDVNCDGVSSVIDVIKMVDVAFRAGDPAAVFCDPCP